MHLSEIELQEHQLTQFCKQQPKPKSALGSLDTNGQAFLEIISDGLCSNCTVLAGGTRLVFEDDTLAGPAQGVYVHHIISIGTYLDL